MPRVTMNEWMPILTTKNAFTSPITTEMARASAQATRTDVPCWVVRYATTLADMPIVEATDRSNSPASRTTVTPSASNAAAAWIPSIVVKLSTLKNVSGRSAEKTRTSRVRAMSSAYRCSSAPTEKPVRRGAPELVPSCGSDWAPDRVLAATGAVMTLESLTSRVLPSSG